MVRPFKKQKRRFGVFYRNIATNDADLDLDPFSQLPVSQEAERLAAVQRGLEAPGRC